MRDKVGVDGIRYETAFHDYLMHAMAMIIAKSERMMRE